MARFNELKSANEQYAASFGKGDLPRRRRPATWRW